MKNSIQYSFERYEKKYFLSPVRQERLLERMQGYIRADNYGKYMISNIYYDTEDWQVIRASVEKPVHYKEKLRVRSYGVPTEKDKVFVELKKKCAGIVYKRRITVDAYMAEPFLRGLEPGCYMGQIGREIAWFQAFHKTGPKVFIGYERQAFVGIDEPELRITFDTNMQWRDTDLDLCLGCYGKPILSDDSILMEIKMPDSCPLWLSRLLSELGIFPVSFSKYGTCYCEHILKGEMKKEGRICA